MSESARPPLVIGAGGAGNYLAQRMASVLPCHTLAINTDAEALQASTLEQTLLIDHAGKHRPVTSRQAVVLTRSKREQVQSLLEPHDTVVFAVGLGGAAGSGITIAVTEMAIDMGLRILVAATLPFEFEASRRASALPVMFSLRGRGELLLVDLEKAQRELCRHESLDAFFHDQAMRLARRVKRQLAGNVEC